MSKPFWLSKTIWVNALIAGALATANVIGATLPAEILAIATPIINILLRWVTSKQITL